MGGECSSDETNSAYLYRGDINVAIIVSVHNGSSGAGVIRVDIHGKGLTGTVGATELKVILVSVELIRSAPDELRHSRDLVIVTLIAHFHGNLLQVTIHEIRDGCNVGANRIVGTLLLVAMGMHRKHNDVHVVAAYNG